MNVHIGFDPLEAIAFDVLERSIRRHGGPWFSEYSGCDYAPEWFAG